MVAAMTQVTRLGLGAVLLLALLGCSSGDGDEGGGTNSPTTHPTDTSAEGIAAFVDDGRYKGEGWTAETETPRSTDGSHGGQVRVWINEIAAAVPEGGEEYPVNAMAVKELYAESELVGLAVILKTGEGTNPNDWLYYCYGPAGSCSNSEPEHRKETPLLSRGLEDSCGFCHSAILTRP